MNSPQLAPVNNSSLCREMDFSFKLSDTAKRNLSKFRKTYGLIKTLHLIDQIREIKFDRLSEENDRFDNKLTVTRKNEIDYYLYNLDNCRIVLTLDKAEKTALVLGLNRLPGRAEGIIQNWPPWPPFNKQTRESHFSSVKIERYRGISGLTLDQLGRVNLIVGINNAGKTSLLEAIELLAGRNDERVLLRAICRRSRIIGAEAIHWPRLVKQLPRSVSISGRFDQILNNQVSVEWEVRNEPGSDIEDQMSFLAHLPITSTYGGQAQTTNMVFFLDRSHQIRSSERYCLCRSAFTSPFSASCPETLTRCHKASLEAGTKPQIINFIRKHIDPGLRNIELADQDEFRVIHDDFNKAPDLATFGEGVRRVFEIGLLCAGVRGGVLLIDEFENAIHTELLTVFTRLLQDLAVELNVQIFLTTHSKEAIDAFILNGRQPDDIAGYAIGRTEAGVKARRYDGPTLQRLHEAVDFDLRGVR